MTEEHDAHYEGWSKQFVTPQCHLCEKTAVAVKDDGWVCEDHRVTGLEGFATLTEDEKTRLLRYHRGAQFTASARNRLQDFALERGWSEETLTDVLLLLTRTGP